MQDAVKESAGHAEVERYAAGLEGIAFSSFRPQYIVGEGNNKDCEEYFFDRIVRHTPNQTLTSIYLYHIRLSHPSSYGARGEGVYLIYHPPMPKL